MSDLKHFGNSMFGPDKDVCQTCGVESNTHNWYNGTCKSCQDKSKRKSVNITKVYLKWLTLLVFIVAMLEMCLNLATLGFYSKWMKPRTLATRLGKYIVRKELE